MAKNCQICGTSNDDKIQFCSACGSPMTSDAKQPPRDISADSKAAGSGQAPKKKAGSIGAKTVMGMPALGSDITAASHSTQSYQKGGAPSDEANEKTVLGMSAISPDELPKKKSSKPPMVTPSEPPQPAKKAGDNNRTVLGMSAVSLDNLPKKKSSRPPMATPSKPPGPGVGPANVPKSAAVDNKRTVLGMPAIDADEPVPTDVDRVETQEAQIQVAGNRKGEKTSEAKQQKVSSATQKPSPGKAVSTDELSPTALASPADSPRSSQDREPPKPAGSSYDEWPDEEPGSSSRGLGSLITIIVLGVIIIVAVGAAAYLFVVKRGSGLEPQIFSTADGKGVTALFSFPEAPQGTTIQIAGQTVLINQAQARVDIRLDELKLGENNIKATYTEPGKPPLEQSFPIILRHLVSSDLSGLVTKEPFVAVNFKIAPEIKLAVEGKPRQLSNGEYSYNLPLTQIKAPETTGDTLIHRVSFQLIDSKGITEKGQHLIAIPVTKLQIDRPAHNAVVASEAVTCAGVTEEGAQVTVNNSVVGVTAIGFNTSVPLPNLGEHQIAVVARVPGKAPRTQTIALKRIESLSIAISDWSKDLNKRLDYPTIGRNPNAHVNKKVKLSGRVININTEKGVTAFLLYIAEGCPKGARCAVYVVFRGETEAGLQSWVNVYGHVKGTRAVDLPSGKKLDVPAVDATFVTKSVQKKTKRRKR